MKNTIKILQDILNRNNDSTEKIALNNAIIALEIILLQKDKKSCALSV